jgi:hypothetical protein
MRSGIIASLATLVLGLSACDGDEESGDERGATTAPTTTMAMSTTAGGEESEGGEEESSSGPGTSATTMPATTEPAEESGAESPGTTTDAMEETGASGDESSTGAAVGVCDPEPGGDPCNECTKTNCCPQLETCFDDPVCVCMSGCVMGFADFEPCTAKCGQTANFMPVTDCAASMCLIECL